MDQSTDNVLDVLEENDEVEADDNKRPMSNPSVVRVITVANWAVVFNWVNI